MHIHARTFDSLTRSSIALGFFIIALFFATILSASASTTATLMPTSDGTYTQWTPNAGATHYTQVDETTCNGLTDYVSETTVGERDSYGVSLSSVPNGSIIMNIQITPCASRNSNGGGTATMDVFYRYNSTNSADAGAYAITGTTPAALSATNFSSLTLLKSATSTLEIGSVCSAGTKGARLSRLATVITYTPPVPTLTTNTATAIGLSSATLNGSANPNGTTATGWFRYSTTSPGICSDSFGVRTPVSGGSSLGSGTSSVNYAQGVSGLSVNTTYYYCAIASNLGGTSTGAVQSFTTQNYTAPSVTTNVASAITQTTATLNGSANPNGNSATGWYRYSTTNPGTCTDAFGTRAPVSSGDALGAGTSSVAYNEGITGLTANTAYYVCAIASNAGGTGVGNVQSFTTLPNVPSAPTGASASNVSGTENSVSWTDASSDEAGFKVERSTNNAAYVHIATTSANATSYSDTGASVDNTYSYRVRAFNVTGNSGYSTTGYVVTATVVPNTPSDLSYFVSTSTPPDVWLYITQSGTNEDGFKVERSADNVNFTEIGTAPRTFSSFLNYFDVGPGAGTYYYRVYAHNAVGNSGNSNTVTVVVP